MNFSFLQQNFLHPYEIAICGDPGSGKTTLIKKLLNYFKTICPITDRVGYIKYDRYLFNTGLFNTDNIGQLSKHLCLSNLSEDFFLIESDKNLPIPKLLILHPNHDNLDQINTALHSNIYEKICGIIGLKPEDQLTSQYPFFVRDDTEGIARFILEYFIDHSHSIPCYGLVLCGGESRRMQRDKSALNYHGVSQVDYCMQKLSSICESVFISCRHSQKDALHLKKYITNESIIYDQPASLGPITGILSAMQTIPSALWCVLGCDLPYITDQTLNKLYSKRNPFRFATAYENTEKSWPEPLCTLYEPKSYLRLNEQVALGNYSPRKILAENPIQTIKLDHPHELNNINTPEEMERTMDSSGISTS